MTRPLLRQPPEQPNGAESVSGPDLIDPYGGSVIDGYGGYRTLREATAALRGR